MVESVDTLASGASARNTGLGVRVSLWAHIRRKNGLSASYLISMFILKREVYPESYEGSLSLGI